MNPSQPLPSDTIQSDPDLATQALPGHGIPSQDPDPAAQSQLEPEDACREAGSALIGGGIVAGMATGAAIGVALSGPVGVVVGSALGAIAGALGGAATGATTTAEVPTDTGKARQDNTHPQSLATFLSRRAE